MAGRFTLRRPGVAELPVIEEAPPLAQAAAFAPAAETVVEPPPPAPPPAVVAPPAGTNPLLTDKLLDAKVRLHRKLIEEINLSALEKLPEEDMRRHVQQLVSQYIVAERLALNAHELSEFVNEILDEMRRATGADLFRQIDITGS